jgi:hypothetical protein
MRLTIAMIFVFFAAYLMVTILDAAFTDSVIRAYCEIHPEDAPHCVDQVDDSLLAKIGIKTHKEEFYGR